MIIKLATFTEEEEAKLRKKLEAPEQIKSKQIMLNYAHPVTILGGATGGFIGSELGDKIFGGQHMTDSLNAIAKKAPGFSQRFAKNVFRGSLGALGAGAGALVVHKFRQRKNGDQNDY